MILAADIGGTKVHIAVFEYKGGTTLKIKTHTYYPTSNFSSVESLLKAFLKENPIEVDAISLGIAGPVIDGRVDLTNLGWKVDQRNIEREFKCKNVVVLNDLAAHAYGLDILDDDGKIVLREGIVKPSNRAIIAAGTGLGQAISFWDGKVHIPSSTEGGHSGFAPSDDEQIELLKFARRTHSHVSAERLISGRLGFPIIFNFLKDSGKYKNISTTLLESQELGPDLSKAAAEGEQIAIDTIKLFVKLYGSEAGNLALKTLCAGGMYICGGIAKKILPWMTDGEFVRAFTEKGRMTAVLKDIPLYIVTDEHNGMKGAAWCAVQRYLQ